ncbi:hypothetical protein ACIGMX_34405 [Streptomyces aquilus]|uniref:hypothetical protein n=1 Tax=Streptomyces aquilus TaxID=2548456 RepID=UPI0037D87A31
MPRVVPTIATESPGNFQTGALWNASVKAMGDWLLGAGTTGVPRFKGYATTAQSLASSTTDTAITLDTEEYDSDNGHSTTTNTSRYTVQVAGTYYIAATLGFAANGSGNRKVGININGASARGGVVQAPGISTNSFVACVSTEQTLAVGDYVELVGWQTSGGALNTAVSVGFGPVLMCHWISG